MFKQKEMLMDKPINLGFSVLEISKVLMYETYYDKLQPYFGEINLEPYSMDTDCFVVSINTNDVFKDLYNLKDSFNFSNLNKEHQVFSIDWKKWLVY